MNECRSGCGAERRSWSMDVEVKPVDEHHYDSKKKRCAEKTETDPSTSNRCSGRV